MSAVTESFLDEGMDVKVFKKPPECGLGKCHPPCLRVFQNIQSFTFFLCIFAVMSGMFPMYLVSQITTIEKHFGMPSQRSGLIIGGGEIGFLICVVFVGHFLNTSHRPRLLASCAFTIGTSSLIMSVPYFAYGTPHKHDGMELAEDEGDSDLCMKNQTIDMSQLCGNKTNEGVGRGEEAFGIFMFAAFLSGCGGTGLWSIGIAFIDDNAGKKESSLYIGMMFCLRSIAPVFGLMFGAGVSRISVDLQDQHLSPKHASWIGAWWIGFLAIGVITMLTAIPLLFYPKILPKEMDRRRSSMAIKETGPDPSNQRRQSIVERAAVESKVLAKSFPKSVWRLLKNPTYVTIVLGYVFDIGGAVGYMSFFPKYVESQFHIGTFNANIVTAAIVLFSAIGMGISGVVTSRIKMKLNDIFLRCVIAVAVCQLLFLPLMAFGCRETGVAGFIQPDSNSSSESFLLTNQTCQFHCNCVDKTYSPVCGTDGITYYSPCYAGCQSGSAELGFSECECVGGNKTSVNGACPSECINMVIPFLALTLIQNLLLGITVMPFVMVSIRCVDEKDKSLALALINFAISCGIFPVPSLYGALLDSLCIATESTSSCKTGDSGSCLIYNNDGTRYQLHGVTWGLKTVAPILYIIAWYLSRDFEFAGDEALKDEKNEKEKQELKPITEVDENNPEGEIIDPDSLKPVIAV